MLVGGVGFLNPALLVKPSRRQRARELPGRSPGALPGGPFAVDTPGVTEVTTRNLADRELG